MIRKNCPEKGYVMSFMTNPVAESIPPTPVCTLHELGCVLTVEVQSVHTLLLGTSGVNTPDVERPIFPPLLTVKQVTCVTGEGGVKHQSYQSLSKVFQVFIEFDVKSHIG